MKTISFGNREITIVGSPMTPFFYKKAFNQSFTGDLAAMDGIEKDYSKLDDINILQIIWAMECTAKMGKDIKDFEGWLADFDWIDITESLDEIFDEAMNATFRERKTPDTDK